MIGDPEGRTTQTNYGTVIMIDVFPSQKITPQQALLQATEELETMEHIAIVYMTKDELHPRLTCSSMQPVDMNFLGLALQNYSLRYLKE
jgi:hypothetical protein